ncbi:cytidylyltransferase domain-containing protein [Winogradskyella sp.]|uniref:cytidylyltransferase domain-containing protein n=1 Tax=Winogradskyella sp. TaxID=1883156 RepID=UPI003AB7EDA0
MKVVAIIQARLGSTRLPKKIFFDLSGKELLFHVVDRLRPSKYINEIVIATTNSFEDNQVENWAKINGVNCFRGSEENVLERYFYASKKFEADIVVRVTADDPFKDYRIIDEAIHILITNDYDFVCNNNPVSFPEGLDVEVLSMKALTKSFLESKFDFEKEHVTQYIHRNRDKFNIFNIKNDKNLSNLRWTIDTKEDYLFAKEVYENLFKQERFFFPEDIYKLLEEKPHLVEINGAVKKSDLYK